VHLQESTVFQFQSIYRYLSVLMVRSIFSCRYILLNLVHTEILHGEVASLGIEVTDSPNEVVAVVLVLFISMI
jgi:hypothetical protein